MQLRICFMYAVSYVLVFAIIPISKANYDAQLAMKMKEMDMGIEEGQLNPVKAPRMMNNNRVAKRSVIPLLSSRKSPRPEDSNTFSAGSGPGEPPGDSYPTGSDSGEPLSKEKLSAHGGEIELGKDKALSTADPPRTRCTTSIPLGTLSPWFLPTSSEENDDRSNFISVDEKGGNKLLNKYIAPKLGPDPLHYIDDEK